MPILCFLHGRRIPEVIMKRISLILAFVLMLSLALFSVSCTPKDNPSEDSDIIGFENSLNASKNPTSGKWTDSK